MADLCLCCQLQLTCCSCPKCEACGEKYASHLVKDINGIRFQSLICQTCRDAKPDGGRCSFCKDPRFTQNALLHGEYVDHTKDLDPHEHGVSACCFYPLQVMNDTPTCTGCGEPAESHPYTLARGMADRVCRNCRAGVLSFGASIPREQVRHRCEPYKGSPNG